MNRVMLLCGTVLLLHCAGGSTGGSEFGETYDAYPMAGGPLCGAGPSGGTMYCKPGDHCIGQDTAKCQMVLSGAYDAYPNAGGPLCGYGPHGGSVYCKSGDSCKTQDAASCETKEDGTYDAYPKAGGPLCGDGPYGGSVYCKPGGTCLAAGLCK